MDDILVLSPNPTDDLKEIATRVKCSDLLPLDSTPQRHVGYEMFLSDGRVFLDINPYIKNLPDYSTAISQLGPGYDKKGLVASNLHSIEPGPMSESYNPAHVKLLQQVVGSLCWIATCHPAVACRHGE